MKSIEFGAGQDGWVHNTDPKPAYEKAGLLESEEDGE